MTKVAIITRTKDRPTFLRRALESVSSQTYDNYVHVIVNDGGDAASVDSLVESSKHKDKIRVFHRETASGAPDTIFNECIDRVDSKYVAIHDDDDTWHSEFLKLCVSSLEAGHEGVVARTDKIIEELSDDGSLRRKSARQYLPDVRAINLYRQCIDNQLTPISFVYSRKAYETVGKYDNSLEVCGDWEFGIRFLMDYDVDFVDPGYSLAFYHHRVYKKGVEGNTSFSGNDKALKYSNLIANRYLRSELKEGSLGIGYIMSKHRYEDRRLVLLAKKIMPNKAVNYIKSRIGK